MSTNIVDHSTAGVRIGAGLRAAGFTGAIRYASAGRADVNITPAEVKDLTDHGVAVGIVNEHAADYLLGGYGVGKQRAKEAQQIASACGLPDGVTYMAGDFDATLGGPTFQGSTGEANMLKISAALHGAGDSIGPENVGFYGGYFAIDWLVHHVPWIKYYWQTPGWSKRLIHSSADVYQGSLVTRQPTTVRIGGVSLDGDIALSPDWGQRTHRPPVDVKAAGHFNASMSLLADADRWDVHGTASHDVHFGKESELRVVVSGVFVGGPQRGKWLHKRMPKNWTPPGGWK